MLTERTIATVIDALEYCLDDQRAHRLQSTWQEHNKWVADNKAALVELRHVQSAPFAVEVQPPAHVLESILLDMEGDYTLSSLRYVVYNDTERGEWLQAVDVPDWERQRPAATGTGGA